jgi:uncharacterized protein (TIGR00266 family)
MNFSIERGSYSFLKVDMAQGDKLRIESGSMLAMSPTLELEVGGSGKGILGSIGAAFGGEGFFATTVKANAEGELLLAPAMPGDIVEININGSIKAQSGSYMASDINLQLKAEGSLRALVSGEGLFLQKITGQGKLFISSYGGIIEKYLKQGERFIVDTGHIVAFDDTVDYKIKKATRGIISSLASGEGFVGEYVGPGRIWMQSRSFSAFLSILAPRLKG